MNSSFKSLLSSTMARVGLTPSFKKQIQERTTRASVETLKKIEDQQDRKKTTTGSSRRAHALLRRAGNGGIQKHYLRKQHVGPRLRQVGVKAITDKNGKFLRWGLLMEQYFTISHFHATKGWRSRSYATGTQVR